MSLRDILSENFLDVNFVKLISPIYWLQSALGSNCIVIKGNLISEVTFWQKLYSVVWIILVTGSFYNFELSYYSAYFDKEITLFYTYSFGMFVEYLCYLCHILHARFYKGQNTVKVFLNLQKVDSVLKDNNVKSLGVVNYYIIIIWILFIIVAFGGGFAIYVFFLIENAVYTLPMCLAIMSVYFEIVFTSTCIYYLAIRLRFLNDIIRANIFDKNLDNPYCQPLKVDQTVAISVLKGNIDDVISLSDLRCIFTSILKLFHDITDLLCFQLFNIVVTVFIWTFLVIESTVVGLRSKLMPIWASMILTLWMVFYFVQLTLVTVTCDYFAQQVHSTKHLALHALSVFVEDKHGKIRKTAWEIIELTEFQKPIFSVRGIFIFDKGLPLKFIGLITSNVVVFIQYTSNALNTN